jgi:D-alanyl-lipoteichoic acid acyltransferase DltB (MBOAT superfamily)
VITVLVGWYPLLSTDKQNLPAAAVLLSVILFVDLNRYFQIESILIAATPRPQWVGALVVALAAFAIVIARCREFPPVLFIFAVFGLILLFVLIKVPSMLSVLSETVSALRGKESSGSISLSWLGFSYVSFRLLHTILDRKAGRLPSAPLAEYVIYVIFFPSFTAGPY